ncbi:MAG: ornithine cyclodeaminase family protein [Kiloniellales bacterium]
MRSLSADALAAVFDDRALVAALDEAFRRDIAVPVRHHHSLPDPASGDYSGGEATLLLMPAWRAGAVIGVKLVTIFPGNASRNLPSVLGSYLLLDGTSGRPLALMDGPYLTARRTAAASALAARYLARPDATTLLMVGTGTLAPHIVRAHAAVRPLTRVLVWGRSFDKADRLARSFAGAAFAAEAVGELAGAVAEADIISTATLSHEPLVRGAWLRPGQHLDLVGGFRPDMREADDEAVRRAAVYVDTFDGATKEGGDIVQPLANGTLAHERIRGDLFGLARGSVEGRHDAEEITFFKSVGTALEDLAAAELAWSRCGGEV